MAGRNGTSHLVIIRGVPTVRRDEFARLIAEGLPGPAAAVPLDAFRSSWIVGHQAGAEAEAELAHRLGRLAAVSYINAGYHVVLHAAFLDRMNGHASLRDRELTELVALMRTLPARVTLVDLTEDIGLPSGFAAPYSGSSVRPDTVVNLYQDHLADGTARVLAAIAEG